jgi:hypothetical protein
MAIEVKRESLDTKAIHVSPAYVDKDGAQYLTSSDRPFPTLDINHLRLHEGRAYNAYRMYPDAAKLAAGASCNIAVAWASNVYAHLLVDASCGGDAELYIYEGATVTGGTSFTAISRNRVIDAASQSAILINPTVTSTGTQLDGQLITGGTGRKAGGGGANSLEMVLKPLTTYLFRLTNVNGTAHMAELLLEWYE